MEQSVNSSTTISQPQYAGFGIRFLAYWVDYLILFPLDLMIQLMMGNSPFAIFQAQSLTDIEKIQSSSNSLLGMAIALPLVLAYFLIFWVNYDGATPGKKLLGIKIVKDNGEKLTYPAAFIRWIGYMISAATMFLFCIGYLWIIWDKKKQALHDKIAGTVVVRTDKQPKTVLAVFLTIIAIFMIFVYIGMAMLQGFRLGIRESQSLRNRQGGVITNMANKGQPLTQFQADELAANIFTKLNEKRTQSSLTSFKEDSQLCAYTQRRLDYLVSLGKQDDGRGFYEDTANNEISRAYFTQFLTLGTILFNLSPAVTSTPDDVVNSWVNVANSSAMSKTYDYACVRANPQFVVLMTGQHK
jgi:uncharacterized RDD family membrane protein YckC